MCVNDLETRDHAFLLSLSLSPSLSLFLSIIFPQRCDDSAVDVIIYCQITPLFLRPETSSLILQLDLECHYMIMHVSSEVKALLEYEIKEKVTWSSTLFIVLHLADGIIQISLW